MSEHEKEKRGAALLVGILLGGAALLFFLFGMLGVQFGGLWSNKGGFGGRLSLPPEAFSSFRC